MKSCSKRELTQAFAKLSQHLTDCGIRTVLQILDNECPQGLKRFTQSVALDYQLAPPHIHHTNAAKKAIDTWKYHFLAGLASVDPNFPIHL